MRENRDRTDGRPADPGTDPGPAPAGSPAAFLASAEDAVVRRTRDGWRVGGADVPDLTCAMVLADLLAAEMAAGQPAEGLADGQAAPGAPTGLATSSASSAPSSPLAPSASAGASAAGSAAGQDAAAASETSRLAATVRQLEHALTARVRVEQAIGVLAERHRIQPRQAFEQLRTAARNRGRRVIDIATDVVASATNPLLQLPDELARPRSRGRARRPQSALETE